MRHIIAKILNFIIPEQNLKYHRWLLILTASALLMAIFTTSCDSDTNGLNSRSESSQLNSEPESTDTDTEIAASDSNNEITPPGQKFLFAVWHINHAWLYTNRGMYIDIQGNVYSFDLSERSYRSEDYDYPTDYWYPEEWLKDKFFANRQYHTTINTETLEQMSRLIKPASLGKLTKASNTACDAGGTTYIAFLYDEDKAEYQSVTLYEGGDWTIENTSSEANILYDWLDEIISGHPDISVPRFLL